MAFLYKYNLLLSCILAYYIRITDAQNLCGGLENRYICDITDPQVFHICLSGNKFRMVCPAGLNFNAKSQVCDWPSPNLCPYDGYSGMDGDTEDDYSVYRENTFEEEEEEEPLQVIIPKPKPTSAPVKRQSPFLRYKNRDKNFGFYDIQANENSLDDVDIKSKEGSHYRKPKASPYRYTRKLSRRRFRKVSPYRSVVPLTPRLKYKRPRPVVSHSPFAPPSDAYSYHITDKDRDTKPSNSPAASSRGRGKSDFDGKVQSKNIIEKREKDNEVEKDMVRDNERPSKSFVAPNVKTSRSVLKKVPNWISRHFSDTRKKAQSHPEELDDHRQRNSENSNSNSKSESKNSHWIDALGLKSAPDNHYPKDDRSSASSLSQRHNQRSDENAVESTGQRSQSTAKQTKSTNQNTDQASQSKRVYHSKNLNKRIYPYRPQKSDEDAPAASSFSNKFALLREKQGYKPSRIGSYIDSVSKNSKKSGKCSSSWCQLPHCRCIGSDIPGDVPKSEVPMMVMLTFDDGVNHVNFNYYKTIFNGSIRNPNGCPIKGTFFVSGDSTNYDMVRQLTKRNHEIASHTLSHRNPTTWWAHASYANWQQEVVGMKDRLAEKSGVPRDSIQGMRAPFLQIGGDTQYSMLYENKFRYDSSMVTGNLYRSGTAPIWPFTLDSPPDSQTCNLTPCPTRSYPGLWEVPLIRWYGSNNFACAMPDACTIDSGLKGTLSYLEENFNRHYQSNKAPFGIFIHASWFKRKTGNLEGLLQFLNSLADREDVWILTVSQMLDWIQDPASLNSVSNIRSWQC